MALKNSGYCTTIVILLVSGLLGKRLDCNAGLIMYNRVIISQYEINKNTSIYLSGELRSIYCAMLFSKI